jgi:8-oxo-dGTP pyrophosphatase MutT (NUDIX family)
MHKQPKRPVRPATPVKKDQSFGVIIYRETPAGREYLLLVKGTAFDLPKGHPERGETPEMTALREAREETGIADLAIVPGFTSSTQYRFRRNGLIDKRVDFFLGKTAAEMVTVSKEHTGYRWCNAAEIDKILRHPNQRALIRRAERYLQAGSS